MYHIRSHLTTQFNRMRGVMTETTPTLHKEKYCEVSHKNMSITDSVGEGVILPRSLTRVKLLRMCSCLGKKHNSGS